MSNQQLLFALLLCSQLSACFAPLVEGARQGIDAAQRSSLEDLAAAGDAQAQYKLGKTYCCETGPQLQRSMSVYDNQKATTLLCRAAVQNYGPAQYQLALIYSGKESSGALIGHVGTCLSTPQTASPTAWIWASLAADNGVTRAAALRDSLSQKIVPFDYAAMSEALSHWRTAPCSWNEVIGTQSASR